MWSVKSGYKQGFNMFNVSVSEVWQHHLCYDKICRQSPIVCYKSYAYSVSTYNSILPVRSHKLLRHSIHERSPSYKHKLSSQQHVVLKRLLLSQGSSFKILSKG